MQLMSVSVLHHLCKRQVALAATGEPESDTIASCQRGQRDGSAVKISYGGYRGPEKEMFLIEKPYARPGRLTPLIGEAEAGRSP